MGTRRGGKPGEASSLPSTRVVIEFLWSAPVAQGGGAAQPALSADAPGRHLRPSFLAAGGGPPQPGRHALPQLRGGCRQLPLRAALQAAARRRHGGPVARAAAAGALPRLSTGMRAARHWRSSCTYSVPPFSSQAPTTLLCINLSHSPSSFTLSPCVSSTGLLEFIIEACSSAHALPPKEGLAPFIHRRSACNHHPHRPAQSISSVLAQHACSRPSLPPRLPHLPAECATKITLNL